MDRQTGEGFRIAALIALLMYTTAVRAFSFCFSQENRNRHEPQYYTFRLLSAGPYQREFPDYPYNPLPDSDWHQPYFPPPAAHIGHDRGVPVNPWEVPLQPETEQR
ncbi:MAG: hypothetical protein PVJ66_01820 [Gammaproteobacteria bacterium]|jgi:hypothetical protein